mgnify:FL=1
MIIISACLCGCDCKYNGKNNKNESCVELLKRGKAVLVCPEQLGGMTTPRVPSEILKNDGKISVISKEGKDVSKEFKKGAKEALKIAKLVDAKVAILKNGSPSCGSKYIYDGTFSNKKMKDKGITAKWFMEDDLEVFLEDEAHKCLL